MPNKFINNLASIFGGRFIGLSRNLLVIPILLKYWGLDYYGEWILLSSITTLLSSTNVGFGTASQIYITHALGKSHFSETMQVLLSNFLIVTSFLVIINLGILILPINASIKLIDSPKAIMILLASSYLLTLITKPLRGFWIFYGKFSQSNNLENLLGLAELAALSIIPIIGFHSLELSILTFIINLIWTSVYLIISLRKFKIHLIWLWDLAVFKNVLRQGLGFQLSALWQALIFQVPLWIIGVKLSPAYVGIWGTLRAFTRVGNQVLEVFSITVGADLQRVVSKKQTKKATLLYTKGLIVSLVLGVLGFVAIKYLGLTIFQFWSKITDPIILDTQIWTLTGLSLIFFSVWRLGSEVNTAYNSPWTLNIYAVFSASISLLLLYFSISQLGLIGAAWSTLIFEILMAAYVPFHSFKLTNLTSRKFLKYSKVLFRHNYSLIKKRFLTANN